MTEKNGQIKNGWYYHKCGRKLFKVTPDMCRINAVEYCTRCKEEFKVTVVNGVIVEQTAVI